MFLKHFFILSICNIETQIIILQRDNLVGMDDFG